MSVPPEVTAVYRGWRLTRHQRHYKLLLLIDHDDSHFITSRSLNSVAAPARPTNKQARMSPTNRSRLVSLARRWDGSSFQACTEMRKPSSLLVTRVQRSHRHRFLLFIDVEKVRKHNEVNSGISCRRHLFFERRRRCSLAYRLRRKQSKVILSYWWLLQLVQKWANLPLQCLRLTRLGLLGQLSLSSSRGR